MNILRLLGDNGADVNIKEATWGYSALMWAAKANNLLAMGYLLEKGANINV
jgi:ankyrin repeat protein